MNGNLRETIAPEECVSRIFEISGAKLDADVAVDVWPRILLHKWLMSEKLGRDVGLRIACIDFLENIEQADEEYLAYKQRYILNEMGAQLRMTMEKARDLEEAVIFIDEFEEIAGSRDEASRIDKSITNELLKQVPLLKNKGNNVLLICATNYIRQLDSALLRPGRFDCIIPVGGLNEDERRTILEHYVSRLHTGPVDLDRIIKITSRFTPADIEYLFQQVAQFAFEQELATEQDYRVTTKTFFEIIPKMRPSLTDEILKEFEKDMSYSRV
jgi:hypothetical protein